jgi:hypothetical protein
VQIVLSISSRWDFGAVTFLVIAILKLKSLAKRSLGKWPAVVSTNLIVASSSELCFHGDARFLQKVSYWDRRFDSHGELCVSLGESRDSDAMEVPVTVAFSCRYSSLCQN